MAQILKIDSLNPEAALISIAADHIRAGEAIAIPTDTLYGLAANPFDPRAVEKVFSIKGRSKSAPLLLLVDSVAMAEDLFRSVPPRLRTLTERFWPGPLTIVMEAAAKMPPEVTAGTGRIGLRLPDCPIAVALITSLGYAITATSANRSGESECSTAEQVQQRLGAELPLIVDGGPSRVVRPSTVIDLSEGRPKILREGAISRADLETFLAIGD